MSKNPANSARASQAVEAQISTAVIKGGRLCPTGISYPCLTLFAHLSSLWNNEAGWGTHGSGHVPLHGSDTRSRSWLPCFLELCCTPGPPVCSPYCVSSEPTQGETTSSFIASGVSWKPSHQSWSGLVGPLLSLGYYTSSALPLRSVSSVAQSCPTLCGPVDCSTPGLPVHL